MELLGRRQRSFPACGVKSMEDFRQRKFGGAPGEVPDDPYGDVFLVIDNFQALTGQASTIRNKDMLADHIQKLITEGGSWTVIPDEIFPTSITRRRSCARLWPTLSWRAS